MKVRDQNTGGKTLDRRKRHHEDTILSHRHFIESQRILILNMIGITMQKLLHKMLNGSTAIATNIHIVWTCECSAFPWKSHNLMVEYNYCPRDVDILVWYLDGQKNGY